MVSTDGEPKSPPLCRRQSDAGVFLPPSNALGLEHRLVHKNGHFDISSVSEIILRDRDGIFEALNRIIFQASLDTKSRRL